MHSFPLVIRKDHVATNLLSHTSRELDESPAQRAMDSVAPSFAVQKKLGVVCLALTCTCGGHCRAAPRVQVYARNFSRGLYRCIHLHTTERSGRLFQRFPTPYPASTSSSSHAPLFSGTLSQYIRLRPHVPCVDVEVVGPVRWLIRHQTHCDVFISWSNSCRVRCWLSLAARPCPVGGVSRLFTCVSPTIGSSPTSQSRCSAIDVLTPSVPRTTLKERCHLRSCHRDMR